MLTEKEMQSIEELIKADIKSGKIELVPEDKIFDFLPKKEKAVRIMSFNIRCSGVGVQTAESRYPLVSETILKGAPDSVGLQEATPEWMEYLKDALADKYDYVGIPREDDGEYSSIFYLKDKYYVVESGNFWLSETPHKESKGWDAACYRICTWAVLENKSTKEKYVHVNTHLDHIGVEARRNGVEMMLEKLREYKNIPAVFTADMNIEEGTENYLQFVNSGFMYDTKHLAKNTMDYLTFHNIKPSVYKDVIDYVMINGNFSADTYRVVTAGIDGKYVSDHFPVYADLYIK
ncbi:MAG: endonuclease/exonuclease/phosphatase family protein [Clostridia bacterium]|nr:endonuclease/exonuclease/phosphatase family protein [Clostridia bacterium]